MRTTPTHVAWLAAWALVASASPAAAVSLATVPLFMVSGAVDSTTAATVVHCSNVSTQTVTVWLDLYGPTGTHLCGVGASAASGRTVTLASRDTQLFVENGTCEFAPIIGKGMARVGLESAGRVICTAQLVDPAHATPLYLARLTLYDDEGNLKSTWIFADDFETSTTARWSLTQP